VSVGAPLLGYTHITRAMVVCLLLMRGLAFAQDVTEPALKAAFIYNFAKSTEWPTDVVPAAEPFVMCVLGDAALADALARVVDTRVLAGHSTTVSQVTPADAQYLDPVSSRHRQDAIAQNGRTGRIGLRWMLWTN
jgi:hypothetical protein